MKTLKCVLALFAFVGLMLVGCSDDIQSPVSSADQSLVSLQKNIIRPFTGYEHPTAVISPGNVYVVDGKQIAKDVKYATHFQATFTDGKPDLLSGDGLLVLNQVLDLTTYEGHATGKLTVTPWNSAAGGVWEINWQSKVFLDPASGKLIYPGKWVGHGKGGAINGMQLQGDDIIKYNPADPMDWWGDGGTNCYVKEHKP